MIKLLSGGAEGTVAGTIAGYPAISSILINPIYFAIIIISFIMLIIIYIFYDILPSDSYSRLARVWLYSVIVLGGGMYIHTELMIKENTKDDTAVVDQVFGSGVSLMSERDPGYIRASTYDINNL